MSDIQSEKEIVDFIKAKIATAKQTLKCREEMEAVWKGGSNISWRAVGCYLSKAARLKHAAMHDRIAEKNRVELRMFETVLEQLNR